MEKSKYKKLDTSKVATGVVIRAIKQALNSDGSNIDWQSLEDEWEEYFEYIENKGIVLGLQIARKKWGEGNLNDLIEDQSYYQDLVNETEQQFD